ncbi:hypothetical protein CASFOL_003098 [Castilleja foliolosa]|uniref:Peroxidase n=1 Tax=Castilleja foliolosa TaxID=1961234 RepID=A0ABD3EG68_9LAMI
MFLRATVKFVVQDAIKNEARMGSSLLRLHFHDCVVNTIVKSAVQDEINKEARMGASLLRLHFHDCFVNGCDASVLLDDTASFIGEKGAAANLNSARGFEVIDQIKAELEKQCPGKVYCADILTLAARDSVFILGGPHWRVELGRKDARTASLDDANKDIPLSNWTLGQRAARFNALGLSTNELVALAGAHTMRQTKNSTSVKFDKNYYTNEAEQSEDRDNTQACPVMLINGKATKSIVNRYGDNPNAFSADFAAAMIKMSEIKPLTGRDGEIRQNCRRVNN